MNINLFYIDESDTTHNYFNYINFFIENNTKEPDNRKQVDCQDIVI